MLVVDYILLQTILYLTRTSNYILSWKKVKLKTPSLIKKEENIR